MIFSLLTLVFLIHCAEEWKYGFPEWAIRHFGPITTRKFYFLSHVPLLIIVLTVSLAVTQAPEILVFRFFWIMILTVIFTNGLFHLASTFIFKEYSPGLVTSLFVTMPYAYVGYTRLVGDLTVALLIASVSLGMAISALIVYSLTWRKVI